MVQRRRIRIKPRARRPFRGARPLFFFAALGASIARSPAVAGLPEEPSPPSPDDVGSLPLAPEGSVDDAGVEPSPAPPTPAPPTLTLSGAIHCLLFSDGEATTIWRHGRQKAGGPIQETTHRLVVRGFGPACEGFRVDFSAEFVVPAVRAGTYTLRSGGVASVWARTETNLATPDIEWDASAGGPRRAVESAAGCRPRRASRRLPFGQTMKLTITSIAQTAHTSDWQSGVTIDVTTFALAGSIEATLPCARSVAAFQPSCRPVTVVGTF